MKGGPLRRRHGAGLDVSDQVVRDEGERRLPERDVERPAAALMHRGEDRERRVHPGRMVDERDANPDAVAPWLAGDGPVRP